MLLPGVLVTTDTVLAWIDHIRLFPDSSGLLNPNKKDLSHLSESPIMTSVSHANVLVVANGEERSPMAILVHRSHLRAFRFHVQETSTTE